MLFDFNSAAFSAESVMADHGIESQFNLLLI